MASRVILVLAILATTAGCSDVKRIPRGGAGGAAPEEPEPGNLSVSVVDRGVPIVGLDILVHGPAGELRDRYVSEAQPILVDAEPGDSVGVVWQRWDAPTPDHGWHLDSARVVADMPVLTLSIETRLTNAPLNTPIDVEITAAEPNGIAERLVWIACDQGGSVPPGSAFVVNGYQGCPWATESIMTGAGYDAEGRLVALDSVTISHDGPPEVAIHFPMTPIQVAEATVTMSWSTVDVIYAEGGAWWHDDPFFYPAGGVTFSATSPASPATFPFPALLVPANATHVGLTASWQAPDEPCGVARLRTRTTTDRAWIADRLARASVDDDQETWWVSAEGARGDAVIIDKRPRGSRFRWFEPPPPQHSPSPIITPELPPDLIDRFALSDDDPDFEIFVEDREDVEGYVAYVADGAGAHRIIDDGLPPFYGETRGRGMCDGRF